MKDIDNRLKVVEERNKRVELDKAWETSLTRRVIIAALTYLVIYLYLIVIGADNALLGAVVPVVGYMLSTLVVSGAKERWIRKQ